MPIFSQKRVNPLVVEEGFRLNSSNRFFKTINNFAPEIPSRFDTSAVVVEGGNLNMLLVLDHQLVDRDLKIFDFLNIILMHLF